jgi:zinc transport system ATP-binding protein
MIQLNGLSFSYSKDLILENVSLEIQKNSFVGIIGPNGGGKSTFLQLLLGLLSPSLGTITIEGSAPFSYRTQIGYVPQKRSLDPFFPISVLEVVMMGALSKMGWLGRYPKKAKKEALDLLRQFDLENFKNHPFGQLSGGQMQKVFIARALLSNPSMLILDEPTASADPYAEENLYQILLSLKGKITILLVTHEVPGILPNVDQILFINKKVKEMKKETVCSHLAMGLYHQIEGG